MVLSEVLKKFAIEDCFRVHVFTKKVGVKPSFKLLEVKPKGVGILTINHLNLDVLEQMKKEAPEYMQLEVLEVLSRYDKSCNNKNECRIVVSDPFGDLSNMSPSEILKLHKSF